MRRRDPHGHSSSVAENLVSVQEKEINESALSIYILDEHITINITVKMTVDAGQEIKMTTVVLLDLNIFDSAFNKSTIIEQMIINSISHD